MKVLILSDCPFTPNSLGKITYYISRGLKDKGFEVYNACPAASVTLFSHGIVYVPAMTCEPGDESGMHGVRGPGSDPHKYYVFPWHSLRWLKKRVGFDIVLLFGSPYAPPLSDALKECYEEKYVCTGYFDNESYTVVPEYALHAANVSFYASPTEFARRTIADGLAETGIEKSIIEARTRVVPHGVDTDFYTRVKAEPVFSDDVFTFGTFSKNHIRKNMAVLLQAYSMIDEEVYRNSRLFLPLIGFGGGNEWRIELLQRYFVMQTMRKDLYDKVFMLSQAESETGLTEYEVLRIYSSMDVFVFPSEGESFGLPPLEAALVGKPVIVSKHPALMEVWGSLPSEAFIEGTVYTLPEAFGLFKPDPVSLRDSMEKLFFDEGLRKRIAEKARETALKYDYRKMVDGLARMLEEADSAGFDPLSKYGR